MKEKYRAFLSDSGDPREYLRNPFRANGKTFYTNGHCFIATDCECDTEVFDRLKETVTKLLADINLSLPRFKIKNFSPDFVCKKCHGAGFHSECPECEGEGVLQFSNDFNDYEVDCETCNGGAIKEFECSSHEYTYNTAYFFGKIVSSKYLKMAADLDGVEFIDCDNDKFIDFVFNGGSGRIMTMSSHYNDKFLVIEKV